MIGIIGAMNIEIEELQKELKQKRENKIGLDVFCSGKLFGKDVVMAVCGPGKVNAAICAQNMIHAYSPDCIINIGVAGAGDDTVNVGDMVIATSTVQHDMDTSPIGDPVGLISKINLIEIPCDSTINHKLIDAVHLLTEVNVVEGVIATGDQFISDGTRRKAIHDRFHSKAVEMEGGAIAHVCYVNQIPCAVLRSISDKADGSAQMDYPTFAAMAAEHAQSVIRCFLLENEYE